MKAVFEMTAKGASLKLGNDTVLVEKIKELIVDKNTATMQLFKHSKTLHGPAKQEFVKRRYTITFPTM